MIPSSIRHTAACNPVLDAEKASISLNDGKSPGLPLSYDLDVERYATLRLAGEVSTEDGTRGSIMKPQHTIKTPGLKCQDSTSSW
jgi:hypothetical protein